jgi:multiple sugar transport system ATP-binding protein
VATISLNKLTKRRPDGIAAVRALTLDIVDGEFFVFTGPSGCGKSTVLNMIAGSEDVSEGEIRIDGEVVNQLSPKDRAIAMIFQGNALYPHMTVRQNMSVAAQLAHTSKVEIDRRVTEAAAILGLTRYLDGEPLNLAADQQVQVEMGRAAVRKPKAILMDEPLSNLDTGLRVRMRATVSRLQKHLDVTTVYVTSDQIEAMALGDRIVVLRFGQMQQIGTPQQLYELPVNMFVAGFIGSPMMNFMAGRLEGAMLQLPIGEVQLPALTLQRMDRDRVARDVIVGIRPEDCQAAALLDPEKRQQNSVIRLKPEIVESVGSHVFAYFPIPRPNPRPLVKAEQVAREIGAEDPVGATGELVARLSRATTALEGTPIDLCFNIQKLHLFDPTTGLAVGR